MVLDNFFNSIFQPLIDAIGYRWSLIIISFILTFLITLAYKLLTKQELMKSLKAELKMLQQELKKVKDHPEKFTRVNKQLMEKNLQYFKQNLRPMIITLIPVLVIFGWLRRTYLPAGNLFSWGFSLPLFGTGFGWLMTYIVSSIIFSMIIRKLLKVH